MMAARSNDSWNLESFLDSFILELDKAQDTLGVKGITRNLTYTVKDVALDLQIFPQYDDGKVRFVTAAPGESGSSRLSLQLGSISKRQIREMAKEPIAVDDISIETIEDLDSGVKESLRKVGVNSARDLEKLEERNVDLERVVGEKVGGARRVSYVDLANVINKARRRRSAPRVSRMSASASNGERHLTLEGDNLVLEERGRFPLATLNDEKVEVRSGDEKELRLVLPDSNLRPGSNQLRIALDPYAILSLEIKN